MTVFSDQNKFLLRSFIPLSALLLLLVSSGVSGQYYGMQFAAHDHSLDQRSGLDLTPDRPLPLKENLELQFYLRFDPDHESYLGYIFRIVVGDQNIDLFHSIVEENPNNLELIIGSKTSKIRFHIPLEVLMQEWTKFSFELDFKNEKIRCQVKNIILEDDLPELDKKKGLRLMFGKHSFGSLASTDLPPMIIRDVEVLSNGKHKYNWPLNETEGNIAHSNPRGNNGEASNPIWPLKRHNTWENILNKSFPGNARTAFDTQNNDLYIFSGDSIYILNVPDHAILSIPNSNPSSVKNPNGLIYNPVNHSLIIYTLENSFITSFDPETRQWSAKGPENETEADFWHHNHIISPKGTLIAFGGYGHFTYKNTVQKWNPETKRFDSIKYKGDFLPRYLAGAGYNPSDSLYYIIGGYGNESGIQSRRPNYHYELLSFSLADSTFLRVHEFQNTQAGFCFASSVVIDENKNMYALYFPKNDGKNKLQLIKTSLDKPEIIELGDPIEYRFLDIKAHAELYYSKAGNSLVAVSTYTTNNQTDIAVHSIAFPPQEYVVQEVNTEKTSLRLLPFLVAGLLILISGLVVSYNRKKKSVSPRRTSGSSRETASPKKKENSIILFGGFQVFDRNGNDITGQFTPLPKKLFLFILLHSLRNNKGVSSAVLYETFWFDKSVESARNNRAVNIVKLKSLLDNLDSASISKETGYWKFDFDPSKIRIDYHDYLQIVRQTSELRKVDIIDLLSTIENKTFLNNTQAEWLDTFKSEISNEIIDTFVSYISTTKEDPEFLLHLTNCIFLFDAVSEEALKIQCRLLIKQGKHSLAKNSYSKFTREYRQLYDEDYGLSFNQVIDEKQAPEKE